MKIQSRCNKSKSVRTELNSEHDNEGFMSLCLIILPVSACKVKKVSISLKNWHLTCHNKVNYWPRVKKLDIIVEYSSWPIRSFLPRSATTFRLETAGETVEHSGYPIYGKCPGLARLKRELTKMGQVRAAKNWIFVTRNSWRFQSSWSCNGGKRSSFWKSTVVIKCFYENVTHVMTLFY